MSNKVHIEQMEFRNVKTGKISYGYIAWDNYTHTFCNELKPTKATGLDYLEFLLNDYSFWDDEIFGDIIHEVWSQCSGIMLNDEWYPYEIIKDVISKAVAPGNREKSLG